MIRHPHRGRHNWSKLGIWLALCLSLATSSGLAKPATAYAQNIAPGWVGPEDVSYPVGEGDDAYGVLLCDPYQNLHILWGKSHLGGSEVYYRTDKDGALSAPMDVLAMADRFTVQLSAAISPADESIHLVWATAYVQGDLYYSRVPLAKAANTRAWDKPQLLASPADSLGIYADRAGGLHIIYAAFEGDGYVNAIRHMKSVDGGLTWGEPTLVFKVTTAEPSYMILDAAIDERDRLHLGITLRSQEYGVNSELGYMRSLDGGETWESYQLIAKQSEATPNVSRSAPFTFGPDEIHLTWHDPRRMHMWSKDGGVTWSNPVNIIEQGAGFGGSNYLEKDSAGVLHAVTSVAGGVYVSTFDGSQWLAPERIENRNMDPHAQQMKVCQGNQLHVTYHDRDSADATVWYARTQVDAPHIERQPIPLPITKPGTVSPSPGASQTAESAAPSGTATAAPSLTKMRPPMAAENPLAPFLIPTTSVIAIIVVALAVVKRRK